MEVAHSCLLAPGIGSVYIYEPIGTQVSIKHVQCHVLNGHDGSQEF